VHIKNLFGAWQSTATLWIFILFVIAVPMDLDVKVKALLLGATFLIVSKNDQC
jgi:hypothetical protein